MENKGLRNAHYGGHMNNETIATKTTDNINISTSDKDVKINVTKSKLNSFDSFIQTSLRS